MGCIEFSFPLHYWKECLEVSALEDQKADSESGGSAFITIFLWGRLLLYSSCGSWVAQMKHWYSLFIHIFLQCQPQRNMQKTFHSPCTYQIAVTPLFFLSPCFIPLTKGVGTEKKERTRVVVENIFPSIHTVNMHKKLERIRLYNNNSSIYKKKKKGQSSIWAVKGLRVSFIYLTWELLTIFIDPKDF